MAYASLIGATVKRKEDPRLITGAGAYVGDLRLPGMHYVAFVRSPYPHAKINGIDAEAALARPGVLAVVTGEEIAKSSRILPIGAGGEGSMPGKDDDRPQSHYALAVGRARHVGEAVAAVNASTREGAADAAADVVVDWEPLPAAVDMRAAAAPDAPRLFDDKQSNVDHVWTSKSGDVDAAFAGAF